MIIQSFFNSGLVLRAIERRRIARLGIVDEPQSETQRIAQVFLEQSIMLREVREDKAPRKKRKPRPTKAKKQREAKHAIDVDQLMEKSRRIEELRRGITQKGGSL
jgi:hypothetical protein